MGRHILWIALLLLLSGCVGEVGEAGRSDPMVTVKAASNRPPVSRVTFIGNVTTEKSGSLSYGLPATPGMQCGHDRSEATAKFHWTIEAPPGAGPNATIQKFQFNSRHSNQMGMLAHREWKAYGTAGELLTEWGGSGFGAAVGGGRTITGDWGAGRYSFEVRLCLGTPQTYTFTGTAAFYE